MRVSIFAIICLMSVGGFSKPAGMGLYGMKPKMDMQEYMRKTEKLSDQGRYAEALERHLWFHDHALEHDAGMSGVRSSFALADWKELADKYPPALQAMTKVRDEKTSRLLSGEENTDLFSDVIAFNRTLGEDAKSIDLFVAVEGHSPRAVASYWIFAKDLILDSNRFDIAKRHVRSVEAEYAEVKAMYDMNAALYDNPNIGGPHFKKYNEENFANECLRLINLAIALDDRGAAKSIREKALKIVDDYRIRDVVIGDSNPSD